MNTATSTDAEAGRADLFTIRTLSQRAERAAKPKAEIVSSDLSSRDDSVNAIVKLMEQAREHRHALNLLESQQMAQRSLFAHDLAEERGLREQAEMSESRIRQALIFKDAAVREAHHRVKNTLQIAASVLSVHARATSSEPVRRALLDSYDRLHLLAKVHALLYASADGIDAILMPTLLEAMADALRQSFPEMSAHVRLQITSDQIVLSPDDAIPMALLANEAMTNAYKHAFPNGSSGEIAVSLHRAPENAVILRITDNGVGMQSGGGENGLGLKLIRTFAAQLQGTLAWAQTAGAAGTAVTLTIHRDAKRRHADQDEPEVHQDAVRAGSKRSDSFLTTA